METNQQPLAEVLNPELKSEEVQTDKSQEANPLAEQFSRIAKQERFVADERKKIEEAKKAFENDKKEVENYRNLKSKDPFEILEHFGVTYEQLLEYDRKRNTDPIKAVETKANKAIEELRRELAQKDEERIRAVENEQLSRAEIKLESDINSVIKSEEFDLIDKLDEKKAVRTYMEDIWEREGRIPDIKEACIFVTNQLVDRFTKIKDSKWLKPKEEVKESVEAEKVEKKSETLSNKMTQSTLAADKPMNETERLKRAIEAMEAVRSK